LIFSLIFALLVAQRPPADFKGNARAAQKSLPGNMEFDAGGENYEARCGKLRNGESRPRFLFKDSRGICETLRQPAGDDQTCPFVAAIFIADSDN
jgi:hypothetical protein